MSITDERRVLFDSGVARLRAWCAVNDVPEPCVVESEEPRLYETCAYYRDDAITICVGACAKIGTAGRSWSYPGYVVDRTPFGVLAHELGHHVDKAHGSRPGRLSPDWRRETGESPITGYASNDNEWFAEMFRLFVTNPDLLRILRPRFYALASSRWTDAEKRPWMEVLDGASRQQNAAQNKINAVVKARARR